MDKFLQGFKQFHDQYFPFTIENKIEEITCNNGLTYYHGWYNNSPFVVCEDSSVGAAWLEDGDFEQEENILDWLVSKGY